MANTWLRLYHDMPNDPKWRTIARVSKQPVAVVMGLYIHLLISASSSVARGTLEGYDVEDLATALEVDSAAVEAILQAMQGRVLDGDKVSGWDKRQTAREDGAAERAKAWREKKNSERKANAPNGSRTHVNADERIRTPDKNREEEIKKEQPHATAFVLPDWIDSQAWSAYEEMRKKNRCPMTDHARGLAVTRLAEFKAKGHSPKAILDNSTMNGYQGLFEPVLGRGESSPTRPTTAAEKMRRIA